jgi:hypothetical protein
VDPAPLLPFFANSLTIHPPIHSKLIPKSSGFAFMA